MSILTDPGRITRPILVVENNIPVINKYSFNKEMTWMRLLCGKSLPDSEINLGNGEIINSLDELEYKGYYINPRIFYKMPNSSIEDLITKLELT